MTRHRSQTFLLALLTMGLMLTGRTTLASDAATYNTTLPLAQNGDPEAQYTLGNHFTQGNDAEKDLKQAAFWYFRAALAGHADAQYHLGLMYDSGLGVAQDYTQALTWYGKAAAQGHSEAQSHKEKILSHIDTVERSADQGEAEAQCTLGDMYANGNGVPQDDERAVAWYRKAAEQGAAAGQFKLGFMYAQGRGGPLDSEQSVAWYRKAAEQGHADAEYHLSTMYYKGLGVPQDKVTAYAWLSVASAQGHTIATKNNAFAASRLTPAQLSQAQILTKELQAKIADTR